MDTEMIALDAAMTAAAVYGWQIILIDQIDGVWTAQAGIPDPAWEVKRSATGADREEALSNLAEAM